MKNEKWVVLSINSNAAHHLYRSAQWSKFFAVLGFLGAAIILFSGAAMLLSGSLIPFLPGQLSSMMPSMVFGIAGLIYLPLGVFYFIASLRLYRFSNKSMSALTKNDDSLLEQSFKNLSGSLRILGIMTIVFLALYLIIFIVMIIMAVGGMFPTGINA